MKELLMKGALGATTPDKKGKNKPKKPKARVISPIKNKNPKESSQKIELETAASNPKRESVHTKAAESSRILSPPIAKQ